MKLNVSVLLFLLSSAPGIAQQRTQPSAYWIVETNVYKKNFTIVKFYDNQNQLLHELKLEGVYLDISKRRHKKRVDTIFKKFNSQPMTSSKKNRSRKSI